MGYRIEYFIFNEAKIRSKRMPYCLICLFIGIICLLLFGYISFPLRNRVFQYLDDTAASLKNGIPFPEVIYSVFRELP